MIRIEDWFLRIGKYSLSDFDQDNVWISDSTWIRNSIENGIIEKGSGVMVPISRIEDFFKILIEEQKKEKSK